MSQVIKTLPKMLFVSYADTFMNSPRLGSDRPGEY